MHFKISKREFINALSTVSRAVSSTTPLPLLLGIKIDVNEDSICLTGSDADISIKKTIPAASDDYSLTIMDTGSVVIKADIINNIVRKMDADDIEVEVLDGTRTKFSGHSVEQTVSGMNVNDYPVINFDKPETTLSMEPTTLMKIITQTCFATSDKETRPVLTGVNFKANGNRMECVATDSYRLAKKVVELNGDYQFNLTIPARSLREIGKSTNEMTKALDKNEQIEISLNDKKAQFLIGDTLIQTRLIDGTYPETGKLIPTEFKNELVVDARDMLNAIDRASFIRTDGVSIIKLSANQNEVVISSRSQEVGTSIEKIDAISYKGEPLEISFSGRYVFDAIQVLTGSVVKISFSGEMRPFIIQNTDDDTILQLVLPVRTYS